MHSAFDWWYTRWVEFNTPGPTSNPPQTRIEVIDPGEPEHGWLLAMPDWRDTRIAYAATTSNPDNVKSYRQQLCAWENFDAVPVRFLVPVEEVVPA